MKLQILLIIIQGQLCSTRKLINVINSMEDFYLTQLLLIKLS